MRDRLPQHGWSEIEIIDDVPGCSAAGGTTCPGFERMVAEFCLGKVDLHEADGATTPSARERLERQPAPA